jgi:hypothetical protein
MPTNGEAVLTLTSGAMLVLGFLLVSAGALKLWQPSAVGHAVYRLLPERLPGRLSVARAAAPGIGVVEVAVGLSLLASGELSASWAGAAAAAAAVLYGGFVAVTVVAIRKGTSCGCFHSLSDGVAGGAELGRSIALAGFALLVLARDLLSGPHDPWRPAAPAAALLVCAIVAGAAAAGSALLPKARPHAASGSPARRAAWLLLGRVTSRLSRVPLGSMRPLSRGERDAAVAAARNAPSVHAFESWLGRRAGEIRWERSVAATAAPKIPNGPQMRVVTVTPSCGPALTLTVSLPWGEAPGRDGVVLATIDGRPVTVVRGQVAMSGPDRSVHANQ